MKNKNQSKRNLIILISVLSALIVALVAVMLVSGVKDIKDNDNSYTSSQTTSQKANDKAGNDEAQLSDKEYKSDLSTTKVEVEMTDGQKFTMEVYPDIAPRTAENFISLVEDGFYDGLIFHRVIAGFMAQGGDPDGTGFGGSEQTIVGEFSSNGYENNLSHQRGVVSMARSGDPNSASSQFFICYDDASFLDGDYAAFGKVVEGMEVVDTFLSAGTDENDRPLKDVRIKTMKVVG